MIGLHPLRRMVRRRSAGPTWGWDFEKPLEVHGYEVQFSERGLLLVLMGQDAAPVAEGLLPFGEAALQPLSDE